MQEGNSILEILQNVTIFAGVKNHDLESMCNRCEIISYPDQEVFIKEGVGSEEIYIITKGKVKVVLDVENDPLELLELGVGHCIGEASVIGIQNHSASVVAEGEVELLVLSRRVLMDIYNEDLKLYSLIILNVARELARRLRSSDRLLLRYKKRLEGKL
ncbi:MAG: Crp/Fnr family transcriptional regulator [Chitinivibrionales bacterium]